MIVHPSASTTLIESYVLDVIRRLPRKQRNDVGFELRALLTEGLRDRAGDAGVADEAMTLAFLREFGRPDDVAARYYPLGPPIIPPAHTAAFAWATVIGVGLQWAITLPLVFNAQLSPELPASARPGAWWVTYGLGAFWWPGFLVTVMMAAAFLRQRWPAGLQPWRSKIVDRDHVSRPLYLLGLAAALAGIGLWVAIAWIVMTTATPFARALAFAPDFIATRAPVLLLFWAAGLVQLVVVIIEGRWRSLTRRINTGMQVAACALMGWLILGGPIFAGEPADRTTKGALAFLIAIILIQLAAEALRGRRRIRPPQAQSR
jgi:hypothetical protein